jgi:hypothetical protein
MQLVHRHTPRCLFPLEEEENEEAAAWAREDSAKRHTLCTTGNCGFANSPELSQQPKPEMLAKKFFPNKKTPLSGKKSSPTAQNLSQVITWWRCLGFEHLTRQLAPNFLKCFS